MRPVEDSSTHRNAGRSTVVLAVSFMLIGVLIGGLISYAFSSLFIISRIDELQNRLSNIEDRVSALQLTQNSSTNITYVLEGNFSLSQLYENVRDSIVLVTGTVVNYDIFYRPYYSSSQGSGFVYKYKDQFVIVTNYHVVYNARDITVRFRSGNAYPAVVKGADPYADLAVLSVNASIDEFKPLKIVSSSTLRVGDTVVAIGNPYGLAGSMSSGIVSALGRTISEDITGGYSIANCIQTTAPINPGNSGGPLLNLRGEVVGITTAIVRDSQGLGFAIPSNTILREIESLVTRGTYDQHPWLGVTGMDMTYDIASAIGVNVTYGWLIVGVTANGPAARAGLQGGNRQITIKGSRVTVGGDIVIGINGTRITNGDELLSFLQEYTLPNQTIILTIVRNNRIMDIPVTLGARPPLS
ncbi:MAG: trypsin-like peptidase domain-containing protein [Candidatus Brockarchaeota archaeon]|nr:trypsin-like peptidase domain-containing protein [Candidatus Brockarchaeota archaeon]